MYGSRCASFAPPCPTLTRPSTQPVDPAPQYSLHPLPTILDRPVHSPPMCLDLHLRSASERIRVADGRANCFREKSTEAGAKSPLERRFDGETSRCRFHPLPSRGLEGLSHGGGGGVCKRRPSQATMHPTVHPDLLLNLRARAEGTVSGRAAPAPPSRSSRSRRFCGGDGHRWNVGQRSRRRSVVGYAAIGSASLGVCTSCCASFSRFASIGVGGLRLGLPLPPALLTTCVLNPIFFTPNRGSGIEPI